MSAGASSDDLGREAGTQPVSRRPGFDGAGVGKLGMWVFLGNDAMGFGALLLGYAVLRTRAASWPDPATRFDRPLAAVLTFVLLCSGASMTAAVAAARAGRRRAARVWLVLTVLGGVAFLAGQVAEFRELSATRHIGLGADLAAALFYVITGYHGLHVLVGLVILIVVGARRLGGAQAAALPIGAKGAADAAGGHAEVRVGALDVASLYWQFVDLIWIVIFTALYLLPPVMRG